MCISQEKRKIIEQGFGYIKTAGWIHQVMAGWIERVDQMFVLMMAAYNLKRIRKLGKISLRIRCLAFNCCASQPAVC